MMLQKVTILEIQSKDAGNGDVKVEEDKVPLIPEPNTDPCHITMMVTLQYTTLADLTMMTPRWRHVITTTTEVPGDDGGDIVCFTNAVFCGIAV